MPALNFQARFAPLIRSGRKRCTIRARRSRPFRPGDRLFLYTGMRTKACRRLLTARCREVRPIRIDADAGGARVRVGGRKLSRRARAALARRDGHAAAEDFIRFFAEVHGLPFAGDLISW